MPCARKRWRLSQGGTHDHPLRLCDVYGGAGRRVAGGVFVEVSEMTLIDEAFAAQAKAMREFGYSDVTADTVRRYHADWMAGEDPSDIVARFCVSAFEDHPRLFGVRP